MRADLALLVAPAKVGVERGRIVILDSLRGFVASIVVLHHVWTIFTVEVHAYLSTFALKFIDALQAQNHRAVMAFFVLSGFTIAFTTATRMPIQGRFAADYLVRRFRRIVPLYYLSLVWTAALGLAYPADALAFDIQTLAGNLLFLQTSTSAKGNWFVPFGANGPYWSLSYEGFYYVALPPLLLAAGGREGWHAPARLRMIGLGLLALLVGLLMLHVAPNPFAHFLCLWIVWIAGFTTYGLAQERSSLLILAAPAVACWLLVAVLWFLDRSSDTLVGAVEGSTLALIYGLAVTWPAGSRFKWLRAVETVFNAIFSRVGRGSYALYLMHFPLLMALRNALDETHAGFAGWASAAVVLLVFVIVFCPWIERVSMSLVKRNAVDRQRLA